jgi:hypothetical protein
MNKQQQQKVEIHQGDKVGVIFPKPDVSVFETAGRRAVDNVVLPKTFQPIFERVDYPLSGGIYAYFAGFKYPKKGFPTPDASHANDIVKRYMMSLVNVLGSKSMTVPAIAFAILPWRLKLKIASNALEQWNRFTEYIYAPFYLKELRMTACTRELWRFGTTFLLQIGIPQGIARRAAQSFATMIEYDDAYRYRVQDLASEMSEQELVSAPIKAIGKMLRIYRSREQWDYPRRKFEAAFRLLRLALIHPKIRRAWRRAWEVNGIGLMKMDTADAYHTLVWDQYNFGGRTHVERLALYDQHHPNKSYPPLVEITHVL